MLFRIKCVPINVTAAPLVPSSSLSNGQHLPDVAKGSTRRRLMFLQPRQIPRTQQTQQHFVFVDVSWRRDIQTASLAAVKPVQGEHTIRAFPMVIPPTATEPKLCAIKAGSSGLFACSQLIQVRSEASAYLRTAQKIYGVLLDHPDGTPWLITLNVPVQRCDYALE